MAEKFRPRQISNVIGQDTVKNLVRRALRNKTFPQFSIMHGPSGTGKSTMAEICGLSITCEKPENGEPCCECKSCKDNLSQLNNGKNSFNLVKINMGAVERTDFKATMKEVFTLQPAMGGSAVYIFEEIQALTKDEQNILLEYISNIPKNVHVIACTTEMNRLRAELKNRAIKFPFKQLKTDEAMVLLDKVCAEKHITKPPADIAKFLIRSTHNCPREIVSMIDFLADADSLDQKTMSEFLGFVPNAVYIQYFRECQKDAYSFNQWLDTLEETGFSNVLKGIRDFSIDCYGYVYGANTQYFNTQEKHDLKEIFNNVSEDKMMNIMTYFSECQYDNETSARYCLIKGRQMLLERTDKTVLRESKREASKAVINSEVATKQLVKGERKVEKISEVDLDALLIDFRKINNASGGE